MIDAVLGFHMNPLTCGVAKFNHQLAQRLSVPYRPLPMWTHAHAPLVSVKASEMGTGWCQRLPPHGRYTLLLHDRPAVVPECQRVLYADDIGCPATVDGDASRGAYRVLIFGMAHKRNRRHYEHLEEILRREGHDYTVEVSTGVHEGTPWDAGQTDSLAMLRSIFGARLRVLGFLADDALARLLHEVDAVAVYYDPALRRNHTSAWAAVQAGKRLITNRDDDSPAEPPTWETVIEAISA